MKIISIIILLLLLLGIINSLVHFVSTPYLLTSPLIPESVIWAVQKNILVQVIFEFPFFVVSIYYAAKKKYQTSLIISGSYILP
jgi:hypothetical protein